MTRFLLACCLSIACVGAYAQTDAELEQQAARFLDGWHDDAAHARAAYFDKMTPDAVYLGTDATELWHREEFRAWARPYFARGHAWTFHAVQRHVYVGPDRRTLWFDELLDTQMGPCRASGVLVREGERLRIAHYQLALAVPNALTRQVTALIAGAAGK
jgi:hypothetical protein